MDINKIKKANTKIIGKKIEYYKEIESTSIYAKQIAKKEESNGKIIIAEKQTKGIGTKGRVWYTGNKNIAMTIILKPKCTVKQLEGFTIRIANYIKETIKELYNIELKIKEPNDLIINNKKIGGILTEICTEGNKIKYMLIGIGFNVYEERFTEQTIGIATSLKKEFENLNIEFDKEDIIIKIIEKLEKEIEI